MRRQNGTFNTWGKWVKQRTRAAILSCACGRKYIRTRERQSACLQCTFEAKAAKAQGK